MTDLATVANRIRHHVVDMCAGPEGGHLGGSLSIVDILTVLYFQALKVAPDQPDAADRDIFLLSKGHGAIALYATLAERGFFPVEELKTYGTSAGRLMGHPVRAVPGVEMPTGSLGHGLPLALGFAYAARLQRAAANGQPERSAGTVRRRRTVVLLGDGELQEGSCWEAAMGAAALGLRDLVAIVDRNGLQLTGSTEQLCPLEPLADRWASFGWRVLEVDGHDHKALSVALEEDGEPDDPRPGAPLAIIAHTEKAHGLSFVAGQVKSHYAALSPRMAARAHRALDSAEPQVGGAG
ncbi:transketolase [Micromonospora sp. DT229]|uniref:transketolase n=1 Tax=Micromonospora sp. DT229 TaxID=3393430 RepID=UPI003CEAA819